MSLLHILKLKKKKKIKLNKLENKLNILLLQTSLFVSNNLLLFKFCIIVMNIYQ